MNTNSLTLEQALRIIQESIQAEHTLIASRVSWYVTSQAFLLTAYAMSWNANFGWPVFFHVALPIAALVLSAVILASIYAATWAQDVYIREQVVLVRRIKEKFELTNAEALALQAYERTMVVNRTNDRGEIVGSRIHGLVRVAPFVLPLGFSLLWLIALLEKLP